MLKKAAVILLTFLFFLTSTNYIFLFIERLETIKNQMQENIALINEASDITILKFSFSDYKNKLNWHEKSEFEFDGRMYDVIEIEQSEDGYTIYCLHDEKEEMLISNFKKLNEINGEQKNFVTVQHSNFVLYAIENFNLSLKRFFDINSLPLASASVYLSVSLDIITPPPRKIV